MLHLGHRISRPENCSSHWRCCLHWGHENLKSGISRRVKFMAFCPRPPLKATCAFSRTFCNLFLRCNVNLFETRCWSVPPGKAKTRSEHENEIISLETAYLRRTESRQPVLFCRTFQSRRRTRVGGVGGPC